MIWRLFQGPMKKRNAKVAQKMIFISIVGQIVICVFLVAELFVRL